MGEFIESFHCLDPSGSFMEMDSGLELICQFPELNGSVILENSSLELMCYSDENCLSHQPDFSMPSVDNLSSLVPVERLKPTLVSHPMVSAGKQSNGDERKRVTAAPDTSSANNIEASLYSESLADAKIMKKNGSGSGSRKRGRRCSERTDKPREVVHVRARRGQATDSHSLAERVRREKINEKMRRLKDLVPGCYRAMGMAGMLDVIIDYVQSLQNQVGFLSMRLAAASTSYDNSFSLDLMEAVATPQGEFEWIISDVPLNSGVQVHQELMHIPCFVMVQKAYLEEEDGLVRDHGGRTSFLSAVPF